MGQVANSKTRALTVFWNEIHGQKETGSQLKKLTFCRCRYKVGALRQTVVQISNRPLVFGAKIFSKK